MSEREAGGPPPPPDPPIFRPPSPDTTAPRTPGPDAPVPGAPAAASAVPTESASPDVAAAPAESGMPGEHRGGFSRLPTAPVGIARPVEAEPQVLWAPAPPDVPQRGLAGWALVFAIAGLTFSLFVGWAFPIGLVAIVVAIIALRRPVETRGVAMWAICLGALSILYSVGWLLWAASRANPFG